MTTATIGEKERIESSRSPLGESTPSGFEAVVDDEITMILLRLHLEGLYKLSR